MAGIGDARRLLDRAGIDAPVHAVGVDGEIVAVTGPVALRHRLAELAPELRALGFRYVAVAPRTAEDASREDSQTYT